MAKRKISNLEQEIAEYKRTEAMLHQRISELALISQTTRSFTDTLELEEVLDKVLNSTHSLLNTAGTSFWMRHPETGELICQHAVGSANEIVKGWRLNEGQGLAGWAAQTGKILIIPDAKVDERHFHLIDQLAGVDFRSVLSIPLRTRQGIIGVLNFVDTKVDHFTQDDVFVLEPISEAAAIAVNNANLHRSTQHELAEQERMVRTLYKQNQDLGDFNQTVAHNLKNPLGILIGLIDYTILELPNLPTDTIREYCTRAKSSGLKAVSLVDELLLLSVVQKTESLREPLNMSNIVQSVLERLHSMIDQFDGQIVLPSAWPAAKGYGPWIEEVWVNYVSNGLKYGGEPPVLELGATPQDGGMIQFWIQDNGSGLTPEAQENLFMEFYRVHDKSFPGHGLGLSIVKRIVEKLDGQVGVDSQVGQGSRFYFTLPSA